MGIKRKVIPKERESFRDFSHFFIQKATSAFVHNEADTWVKQIFCHFPYAGDIKQFSPARFLENVKK
jgi:hypothetical protein